VNIDVKRATTRFDDSSGYALRLREGLWMPLASEDPEWLERAMMGRGLWRKALAPKLSHNRILIDGRRYEASTALGLFDDGTKHGWEVRGSALKKPHGPVAGKQSSIRGAIGSALANSFHPKRGDAARGSLLSPEFVPKAEEWLVFLVGGGKDRKVGVELRVEERVVATYRGLDSEEMLFEAIDLSRYAGKPCRVRIFDDSTGAWGHVLADHFLLVRPVAADAPVPAPIPTSDDE
jgi:hypothetical protein